MAVEPTVLLVPDPEDADSLVSSNDPDDMQNEQTWPTEEEMQDDSPRDITGDIIPEGAPGTTPRAIRRVPKGTSAYQAAWILDEDEEDEECTGDENEGVQDGNAEEQVEVQDRLEDEMEVEAHKSKEVTFQDLDDDEENMQSVQFPLQKSLTHSSM
jgi:pre-rRNA-processing protein TSR1